MASVRNKANVGATMTIAGTQFVIAVLTFALGIVARVEFNENYWVNISYGGIWSAVFIGFAAVFSFLSSVKPNSPQINIANLIFSLLATASAVFNGILSTIALRFHTICYNAEDTYSNNSFNKNAVDYELCSSHHTYSVEVYGLLTTFMVIEFFVALGAVVLSCQSGNCLPSAEV
ncbi:uncharacterized protein LOC130614006 isoform X3 [Hydractinia symbiolongicarpus]|uniref:uncharacterized protein LOC130614006 isoform X3 n=1 Tax=Hydractinia symbiolongicarpus TaxID=13093 RepID=UPI00254A5D13|nr:uncharacterized protein LOC130614006 isoform X3 [Hydractinia symbiolongicarpus]